jgi:hypothetical protein
VQSELLGATLDGNLTLSASATFLAGAPSASTSSLSVSSPTQIADGVSNISVTLTVRDLWGHPLGGLLPIFSVSGAQTSVPAALSTTAQGQSSIALQTTLAQSQNVSVGVSGWSLTTGVRFVAGAVSSRYSTLVASPNTLVANGSAAAALNVYLADINNNPVPNQNVVFSVAGNPVSWQNTAPATGATGTLINTVSSALAGPRKVFAQAQNVTLNANIKLTARSSALCIANPNYGLFTSATTTPFGAVFVTELNNDAKSDIVVANGNQLSVYWGNGQGFGTTATTLDAGGVAGPITAGDINGDGFADIVVLNATMGFSVLTNVLGTSFAAPVRYALSTDASVLVLDDFNGDGRLDVGLALLASSNAAAVMLNTGSGQFAAPRYFAATGPAYGLTTADFNRDGMRDLAITNYASATLTPMLGAGDGTFALQAPLSTGTGPKDVRNADINIDGIEDLVVLNVGANSAGVFLGTGNATWLGMLSNGVGNAPSNLVIDDLNGDSYPDIVTLSASDKAYSTLLGQSNGLFSLRIIYATGTIPSSLATGDFNRDGYRDVVVANGAAGKLGLYMYNSCVTLLGLVLSSLL